MPDTGYSYRSIHKIVDIVNNDNSKRRKLDERNKKEKKFVLSKENKIKFVFSPISGIRELIGYLFTGSVAKRDSSLGNNKM